MEDEDRSTEQLLRELASLRQRSECIFPSSPIPKICTRTRIYMRP